MVAPPLAPLHNPAFRVLSIDRASATPLSLVQYFAGACGGVSGGARRACARAGRVPCVCG